MKAFNAFVKPLDSPQRSVKKKKLKLFFSLRPGLGREVLTEIANIKNIKGFLVTMDIEKALTY